MERRSSGPVPSGGRAVSVSCSEFPRAGAGTGKKEEKGLTLLHDKHRSPSFPYKVDWGGIAGSHGADLGEQYMGGIPLQAHLRVIAWHNNSTWLS